MINTPLFKYYMAKNHDTLNTLADALGIAAPTVSLKLNEKHNRQFTANELQRLKERWNLTAEEAESLFFPVTLPDGPQVKYYYTPVDSK